MDTLSNFPKINAPFIRKEYKISPSDQKRLNINKLYLITPQKNDGYDWVFDKNSFAVEKLHGTNICVEVEDGKIKRVQNRMNKIDITSIINEKSGLLPSGRILEGILAAAGSGYVENNRIQYGELIGDRINGNIHKIKGHLWVPFDIAIKKLVYSSFNKYPKEFWGWCDWFRTSLKSLLYCRHNKVMISNMFTNVDVPFTEGIVIYQKTDDKVMMSKLRRDMFPWFYWDKIHIMDLEDHWLEYAEKHKLLVKGY